MHAAAWGVPFTFAALPSIPPDIGYLLVVAGLFIVPRILERYRIPGALTCLGLGAILGMGFGLLDHDLVVKMLATFGIVALFLFAGLEVELDALRESVQVLLQHLVIQVALVGVAGWLVGGFFDLGWRARVLTGLAIVTPSAGFILDSLARFGLTAEQRRWVTLTAIATEILALSVLFVVVQSSSMQRLAGASAALVAMILLLPPAFRFFAERVQPVAPRSEFGFLVIAAMVCAFITLRLGVYYLVGAFVVGVTAVRLRKELPQLLPHEVLEAIELFAKFFVPFYFFRAGLQLTREDFTATAVGAGIMLVAIAVPVRVAVVALHRRWSLGEAQESGLRIGMALTPTLVFTIVLADILLERYQAPRELHGMLVTFTLLNTMLPGFVLRTPAPAFEAPEVAHAGEREAVAH